MITRRFVQSSLIYSIVGALPYTSGFILIFWFTRYLTPAQFGVNVLYLTLMYLVQIIAAFGLDMSAAVMYIDYKKNLLQVKRFLGTIFLGLLVFGLVTAILFAGFGFQVFNAIFSEENVLSLIPFGLLTIVSGWFNGVFKTYSALLVYQQRPARFFWINSTNFLATIAFSLILLYLYPYTLYGPVLGRLIPALLVAAMSSVLWFREFGFSWDRAFIKSILSFTFPLMLYALLTWIVNYIDRFVILRFLDDPAYVGIYDFGVKLVLGIELVLMGMVNVVNPKIFNIWKDKDLHGSTPEVNRYYSGLTAFILLLIPLFVFLAPLAIPLVINREIYYQAFSLLALLAAGYAARVWFYMFMAPLMFFKRTRSLPGIFAISAVFEIALAIGMVRYFGIMGAVWVNFLIKPLQALLLYFESRKVFHYHFNRWKILYLPMIFMCLVIVSEWLVTKETRIFFHAGQLLVSVILVWFAYRRELIPLIRTIARLPVRLSTSPPVRLPSGPPDRQPNVKNTGVQFKSDEQADGIQVDP